MEKLIPKSRVAKISLLLFFLTLLLLIPFISPSLKSSYLYLLLNLLILILGAEAGFLSAILSKPHGAHDTIEKKLPANVEVADNSDTNIIDNNEKKTSTLTTTTGIKIENILKLKKCLSRPSLFFIGCSEEEEEEEEEEVVNNIFENITDSNDNNNNENGKREEGVVMSNQELFMKAEVFIGNFYKQLKMQREDSWKKLHGLSHKSQGYS